ncbi:MAG: hypothetical protein O3C21_15465, partial [Verrucomicrobia bacterium]|nr:hypothetical protein [Verrucomicrobiota bacterium]
MKLALCLLSGLLLSCDAQRDGSRRAVDAEVDESPGSVVAVGAASAEESPVDHAESGSVSVSLQSNALGFHRRLADELANVDPSSAGWESETFSEFVSAEMKHVVAEILEHPGPVDAELMAALVSEGFACTSLRAEKLAPLMDEHEIAVNEGAAVTSDRRHLKVEGFVEALSLLAQPFDGATEVHAKFKVMHVEKQDARILTRLLFEMGGKKSSGWVQATSVWHCEWTVETPWRLMSVEV